MPKRSAASLAIVTPELGRPKPPAELTAAEAALWDAVVSTKAAEWFTRDTFPLLIAYCRAKVGADIVAGQIEKFQPEWLDTEDGLKRYDLLLRMQDRQGKLLATLATKMRLAQQSRYGAQGANSHVKRQGKENTPWEPKKLAAG